MKTGFCIILSLLLPLGLPGAVSAEAPISLAWAFFLKDDGGEVRSLSFDQPEAIAAGDLLRIYLQLQEKTYVYLYLHDSRRDLYLVFPPGPDFYGEEFPVLRKFYIPSERGWFILDRGVGTERFYLLVSHRRLIELEELTEQFLLGGDNRKARARLLAAIQQQSAAMAAAAPPEQSPIPVAYAGGQPAWREMPAGSMANLTRASDDFSLVLDLVNR